MLYNIILLISAVALVVLILVQFFADTPTIRIHANRGKVTMLVGAMVVVLIYLVNKDFIFHNDNKYSVVLSAFFLSFFATGWSGYMTYHKNEENMFKHKMFTYLTMGLLFVNLAFGIEYLIKLI